jgi:serine/threonine protein kinase
MDKGSLEEVIPITKTSEQLVSAIAYQMLWGLSCLHFEKMIHRDVKPGNVLLDSSGQVKLSDFGIACSGKEMSSTVVGTTLYMAPERLLGQEYGSSSDVWSMGLVLWLSATGVFPFQDVTSLVSPGLISCAALLCFGSSINRVCSDTLLL